MRVRKSDYQPMLAPGRHFLTLLEVEDLCVKSFDGKSRKHRERLFLGLEEMVQSILRVRLPCRICVDGSFLTHKPEPEDVDAVVCIDYDVSKILNEDQRQVIDIINEFHNFDGVDSTAFFNYPRDHECFGCGLDAISASEGYGLEHSEKHLKGYVVLRIWETDVGIRICN